MSGKNIDYKRKMRSNQVRKNERLRKVIVSTAFAGVLITSPISFNGENLSYKNVLSTNTVSAESLANVQLLSDVSISADNAINPYEVSLSMTGTGLAEAELAAPDRVAVFYIPELAGHMHEAGQADVRVEILPITMDDLPALGSAIDGLTGTLTGLVTGLIEGIDDLLPVLIPSELVEIKGLTELNAAIDNLNNLDSALEDLLAYEDQVDVVVNNDGSIVINFTDGLGNHLETAIKDVVQSLLDDVSDAVNALEINILSDLPIVGDLLDSITNQLLLPFIGNVTDVLTSFTDDLTDGTIDLTNDLAGVQVIGEVSINANIIVDEPASDYGVYGEVDVYGVALNTSVIDIKLLSNLEDKATLYFPENDGDNDGSNDGSNDGDNDGSNDGSNDGGNDGSNDGSNDGGNDGSNDGSNGGPGDSSIEESTGKTLPNTATSTFNWMMGGIMALIAGLAGLVTRRRKEDETK